jgi:autotransporter-associated beta strand protein
LQIESGAAVNLTGAYAANNINRTFAGLTGAGVLYGGGGTVTVNKASGTDIFSGDIQGAQGLIKDGAGTLALAGANNYTGTTAVNAGTLALANGGGLGSTAGGTIVADGAQLRFSADTSVISGFTVGNEALTISGPGVNNGGALRNVFGDNTYQGKITLAADAKIGVGGSSSLTLDVASGNAIEATDRNLTFDGAGTTLVNDGISLGTGGVTKIGSGTATLAGSNTYSGTTTVSLGTLVVSNSTLTATILPNSVLVNFPSTPTAGTYNILSGPLASASLGSTTVTVAGGNLPSGLDANVVNNPLRVIVTTSVPTFDGAYPGINPLAINLANGLSYLMNYALGGTGPSSNPALPVLTSNASSLTLTANIRNSGQGVSVVGQYAYDLAGPWTDVALTPTGAPSSVVNTTVKSFSQAVESNKPRKFLRLKAVAP